MMTRLKTAARRGFQSYLRAREVEAARTVERHRDPRGVVWPEEKSER